VQRTRFSASHNRTAASYVCAAGGVPERQPASSLVPSQRTHCGGLARVQHCAATASFPTTSKPSSPGIAQASISPEPPSRIFTPPSGMKMSPPAGGGGDGNVADDGGGGGYSDGGVQDTPSPLLHLAAAESYTHKCVVAGAPPECHVT